MVRTLSIWIKVILVAITEISCLPDNNHYMNKERYSSCISSLECLEGCCRLSQCFEKTKCNNDVISAYIGVGIVGITFLLFGAAYFVYSIIQIKNQVKIRQSSSRGVQENNKKDLNYRKPAKGIIEII